MNGIRLNVKYELLRCFQQTFLVVYWCSQRKIYLLVGLLYEKKKVSVGKQVRMFICDLVSATEQLVGFS